MNNCCKCGLTAVYKTVKSTGTLNTYCDQCAPNYAVPINKNFEHMDHLSARRELTSVKRERDLWRERCARLQQRLDERA